MTSRPRVAIVDVGFGNVLSVVRALEYVGAEVQVATDAGSLRAADRIVLPGVGAFGPYVSALDRQGFSEALRERVISGASLLGICLGMHALGDASEEGGGAGLGLVRGSAQRILVGRVPHQGWDEVEYRRDHPVIISVPDRACFYFAHSYVFYSAHPDDVRATFTLSPGVHMPAVVAAGNIVGVQFHPEKSQRWGLRVLENFVGLR